MSRNIIFVSHCDFRGNSAMHLYSIANVLNDLGHRIAVCVPSHPETVLDHGAPRFQVLSYEDAIRHGVTFANGRPPDLIHAWTPRELVRKTTERLLERYRVPYFVHFEDNEVRILLDESPGKTLDELERLPAPVLDALVGYMRTHPLRSQPFLGRAAGVTALIESLLQFKPEHVPGLVFSPGHDAEFATLGARDETVRSELGVAPGELLMVYPGNVHLSNFPEVRSLLLALAIVNRNGLRVKLVKTGWNYYPLPEMSRADIAPYLIDRGFVSRGEVSRLIGAADILVQPGRSNEFNDFRVPSKLPEFLASGRPVILPRTNLGNELKDGEEALLLEHGHSSDIVQALQRLAADPELRARIGRGGRAFALRRLSWETNAATLPPFYDRCLAAPRLPAVATVQTAPRLPKLLAFYLPQFHPVPENDAWWGKGFTEWTNVTKAKPNFEGHLQPRLPADLGFYDLRVPEVMDAQVALARTYGIHGFCFYYYWFNGRRILERPLQQFLDRGGPEFPFCIAWANENWTRRWDGQENEILLQQEYTGDFALKFIRDVIPILKDARYVRVDGAPLLIVYRADKIPDPRATAEIWRDECRRAGIPHLHLAVVQAFGIGDPEPFGFDAAIEFPPHTQRFLIEPKTHPGISPDFEGYLEDYQKVAAHQRAKPIPDYTLYRGVMPAWDNTPRNKKKSHILLHSSPEEYQSWLRSLTEQTMALAEWQEPFIFVNAWNEWAEGAFLEPDVHYGHRNLEATRAGLTLGLADHLRSEGMAVDNAVIPNLLMNDLQTETEQDGEPAEKRHRTDNWFSDGKLSEIYSKYHGHFDVPSLSYATVRDFCESIDHLTPLATANGDLKDSERPWVLKAILSKVRRGGRVLEIGAGEPIVADLLERLGYEVWIADPYDGTGNGPLEFERFQKECPNIRFVRGFFGPEILSAPPSGFDCIYSISVLEHVPGKNLGGVFQGMKKYLKPDGWSIHAVDHVHRGNGAKEHYDNLASMVTRSGIEETEFTNLLTRMDSDPDTYYLSAESHNRWRGSLSYDEFPMRVCVSIQLATPAATLSIDRPSEA